MCTPGPKHHCCLLLSHKGETQMGGHVDGVPPPETSLKCSPLNDSLLMLATIANILFG